MNENEVLKLKLEIYKIIYSTIALEETGLEALSEEIHTIEGQLEILDRINYSKEDLKKSQKAAYWQGYADKEQEAVTICEFCKYRQEYRKNQKESGKNGE